MVARTNTDGHRQSPCRGATALAYGVLLGLISILGLSSIGGIGASLDSVTNNVAVELAGGAGCEADSAQPYAHPGLAHRSTFTLSLASNSPGDQPPGATAWEQRVLITCTDGTATGGTPFVVALTCDPATHEPQPLDEACVELSDLPPSAITLTPTGSDVPEDADTSGAGLAVATIAVSDDGQSPITVTVDDNTAFAVDGDTLRLIAPLDFEAGPSLFTARLTATDAVGRIEADPFTVSLSDVDEGPPSLVVDPSSSVTFTVADPARTLTVTITAADTIASVTAASDDETIASVSPAILQPDDTWQVSLTPVWTGTSVAGTTVTVTVIDAQGDSDAASVAVTVLPTLPVVTDIASGVRGWSDGNLALSCKGYINAFDNATATGNDSARSGLSGASSGDDGVYRIDPDGSGSGGPQDVWCDMGTDGGGWTLAMRVSDSASAAFTYHSSHWTSATTLNSAHPAPSVNSDAKYESFNTVGGQEVRGCLRPLTGGAYGCAVGNYGAPTRTLLALFRDTPINTRFFNGSTNGSNAAADRWTTIWGQGISSFVYPTSTYLADGINLDDDLTTYDAKVRLGAMYNGQTTRATADNTAGFGAAGAYTCEVDFEDTDSPAAVAAGLSGYAGGGSCGESETTLNILRTRGTIWVR